MKVEVKFTLDVAEVGGAPLAIASAFAQKLIEGIVAEAVDEVLCDPPSSWLNRCNLRIELNSAVTAEVVGE